MCTCRNCLGGVNNATLGKNVSYVSFNVPSSSYVFKISIQRVTFTFRSNFGMSFFTYFLGTLIRVNLCVQVIFGMSISGYFNLLTIGIRAFYRSRRQGSMSSARVNDLNLTSLFTYRLLRFCLVCFDNDDYVGILIFLRDFGRIQIVTRVYRSTRLGLQVIDQRRFTSFIKSRDLSSFLSIFITSEGILRIQVTEARSSNDYSHLIREYVSTSNDQVSGLK